MKNQALFPYRDVAYIPIISHSAALCRHDREIMTCKKETLMDRLCDSNINFISVSSDIKLMGLKPLY